MEEEKRKAGECDKPVGTDTHSDRQKDTKPIR